jgi:hypothetical protein
MTGILLAQVAVDNLLLILRPCQFFLEIYDLFDLNGGKLRVQG